MEVGRTVAEREERGRGKGGQLGLNGRMERMDGARGQNSGWKKDG